MTFHVITINTEWGREEGHMRLSFQTPESPRNVFHSCYLLIMWHRGIYIEPRSHDHHVKECESEREHTTLFIIIRTIYIYLYSQSVFEISDFTCRRATRDKSFVLLFAYKWCSVGPLPPNLLIMLQPHVFSNANWCYVNQNTPIQIGNFISFFLLPIHIQL